MTIHIGNCLGVMATMNADKFDSIVTDPPYGLGFMGKEWDHDIPGVEFWAQALRVAKPGAHMLAFGGTRKFHRMACAIEDAGWEIRDTIMWVYGSGFPKSHNLEGAWSGWGTALKPSWEPIIVARKPLIGAVADNVHKYGTGAMNIDGCRVETSENLNGGAYAKKGGRRESQSLHANTGMNQPGKTTGTEFVQPEGRWPANLIHDGSDEVLTAFPVTKSGTFSGHRNTPKTRHAFGAYASGDEVGHVGDTGSAARFFYCAKASREDRNDGLDDPGPQFKHGATLSQIENTPTKGNNHPTVKPTDLMRYLCRLVTPKGGVILDPFAGSGSTGKAAILEGFQFVGIELNPEYAEIAKLRLKHAKESLGLEYFFDNSC